MLNSTRKQAHGARVIVIAHTVIEEIGTLELLSCWSVHAGSRRTECTRLTHHPEYLSGEKWRSVGARRDKLLTPAMSVGGVLEHTEGCDDT